jgi:hypothetical protein
LLSLDILNHTNSIIDSSDPFIQELPYDNAATHVKRIEAFPGHKIAGKQTDTE